MADVQLLRREDLAVVRCPKCRGPLLPRPLSRNGDIEDGFLDCEKCGEWTVEDGLPVLVDGESLHAADRFFRLVYGLVAPFHDAGVRYVLPLVQWSSEASMRGHYLRRMRLHSLTETEDRPLRILEVGAGTGANWRLIEDRLPVGLNVEFWAVDLNRNMLDRGRRRTQREVGRRVRHLLADAHALPFEDASFDRVFHVGGIASYGDKKKALAEMARVARPGTPIVVVDERLDPMRFHLPYHYVMFRALTAYDLRPDAPVDDLPYGSKYRLTQASRFYYCLTFETWSTQLDTDYRSNDMAQPAAIAELGEILKDKQIATLKAAYGDGKSMSDALATYLPGQLRRHLEVLGGRHRTPSTRPPCRTRSPASLAERPRAMPDRDPGFARSRLQPGGAHLHGPDARRLGGGDRQHHLSRRDLQRNRQPDRRLQGPTQDARGAGEARGCGGEESEGRSQPGCSSGRNSRRHSRSPADGPGSLRLSPARGSCRTSAGPCRRCSRSSRR